jgi:hypothetical protein
MLLQSSSCQLAQRSGIQVQGATGIRAERARTRSSKDKAGLRLLDAHWENGLERANESVSCLGELFTWLPRIFKILFHFLSQS